jgi:hypothetical protein
LGSLGGAAIDVAVTTTGIEAWPEGGAVVGVNFAVYVAVLPEVDEGVVVLARLHAGLHCQLTPE